MKSSLSLSHSHTNTKHVHIYVCAGLYICTCVSLSLSLYICDEAWKVKNSKEATAKIFKDVRKEIKMASGAVCESLSSSARNPWAILRVKLVFLLKNEARSRIHVLLLSHQ